MTEIVQDYLEIKSEINKISDTAAAILVLADRLHLLPQADFRHCMEEFGHQLALALKNVAKESVLKTETEINGNLAVTVEKL
jgi:hypothetical protein